MNDASTISKAAALLRSGRVVAFPTETVYGLGADALNADAVSRVFAVKGRPSNNPLIVHVSGPDMARRVAREWPDAAARLAREFWPGPLSILVPRRSDLPERITAGGDLVAVRCPNHPVALALLFEFGGPIVGPSANLSGQVSPTTAAHVRESFDEDSVFVIDGGACHAGIESTVVDVTSEPVRVLRPGVIGAEQIAEALGCEVAGTATETRDHSGSEALASPGLLEKHYSPRTPSHLFDSSDWPQVLDEQTRAMVITHRRRNARPPHEIIELPGDAAGYAAALYAALRSADTAGATAILIERPPGDGHPIWIAVADRLRRATAD